jgi:hypothetical protein
MKLSIFGATGATGASLTGQALAPGMRSQPSSATRPAWQSRPTNGCGSSPPTS